MYLVAAAKTNCGYFPGYADRNSNETTDWSPQKKIISVTERVFICLSWPYTSPPSPVLAQHCLWQ